LSMRMCCRPSSGNLLLALRRFLILERIDQSLFKPSKAATLYASASVG